jgi:osmotically-inducible protein OsmY
MLTLTGCLFLGAAVVSGGGVILAEDKRSIGNIIDDKVITNKIWRELSKNSIENSLDGVITNVYKGRVLLTGYVKNFEYQDQAEKIAWITRGVTEVINDIVITEKNEANTKKDFWITTKVTAKFLASTYIHSVNYKITTYHNVVYLLGVSDNQEELDTALQIASQINGVTKVKNYVIIKNDAIRNDASIINEKDRQPPS